MCPCRMNPAGPSLFPGLSASTDENSPPTLVERFTGALVDHFPKQLSHGLDFSHARFQLRQLALRESLPPTGSGSPATKSKEQFPDFVECESELASALNNRQPVQNGRIVASLPTDPLRRRKNSDLLVIADGRRAKLKLLGHLRDGQKRHS